MPDAIFDHPRVAAVLDALDPDRSDLDTYVDLAGRLGVADVLDVGCGTGVLACRLAARGVRVVGIDPAAASVAVARGKPHADAVTWVVGTAPDLLALPDQEGRHDLATMTANVAQVFLEDEAWLATLTAVRTCLRPGGTLAFESRAPADRAWERWTEERTRQVVDVAGVGPVEDWVDVVSVVGDRVTFVSPTIFHADGERIDSVSTLRFRPADELRRSVLAAGYTEVTVQDLPHAPGRGWLVLARA